MFELGIFLAGCVVGAVVGWWRGRGEGVAAGRSDGYATGLSDGQALRVSPQGGGGPAVPEK